MLRRIVDRLRQHWPDLTISVRGDCGLSGPEMYDYCEDEGLLYALGYSTNAVLERRVREEELKENARLLTQAIAAVSRYIRELHALWRGKNLFVGGDSYSPRDRAHIQFAPVPPK